MSPVGAWQGRRMDEMEVLTEIYRPLTRQGPGSDAMATRAMDLCGLRDDSRLRVADLGSGTGSATILLAEHLSAEVVAVDLFAPFLEGVLERARAAGVEDRVTTLAASIDDLPFGSEEFDVIWSEGAAYNIGFAEAVRSWRQFLKPGGTLVLSDITWTTVDRPREIEDFWIGEYPQIDLASAKLSVLERAGYVPEAFFMLPGDCWTESYYEPVAERLSAVEELHGQDAVVVDVVAALRHEIDLYRRFGEYFSYGMYVARRI